MNSFITGKSGSKIEILNIDGRSIARKTSPDFNYNNRLKKQFNKQKNLSFNKFKTVQVYENNTDHEGHFYFDMSYIPGLTLANHLKYFSAIDMERISIFFLSFYRPTKEKVMTLKIKDKVESLYHSLDENLKNEYHGSFNKLREFQFEVEENEYCHGDLSLENIIYHDGNFFLIDFLDSFIDSWEIDISKLIMDLDVKWSFRNLSVGVDLIIRIHLLRATLIRELIKNGLTLTQFKNIYFLSLLHALRILPYATKSDLAILKDGIREIELKILNLEKEYDDVNRSLRR